MQNIQLHLVHVVTVDPGVEGLVQRIEQIKKLQPIRGQYRLCRPIRGQYLTCRGSQILAMSLNSSISVKQIVAESNISEVVLFCLRLSATDLGNI